MPQFLENLFSNPVYIAIAVVIVLVLVYSIMKRVIKLIIFIIILLIAFLTYMHYTGGSVNDSLKKAKERIK